MNWLMIGSSPMAVEATARIRDECKVDKVITCNRGIAIEPTPDYYFLSDSRACKMWNAHAREAQRNGCQCVTLKRSEQVLQKRGIEWFDLFVPDDGYEPFQMSGVWCLEFAAMRGAKTIYLAGMDGYCGDMSVPDYFIAEWGHVTRRTDWTNSVIKPKCDVLAAKYPYVAWIQCGEPRYRVEAPNWQVIGLSP